MNLPALDQFRRIVVKVGSSLLVDRAQGRLRHAWLAALAEDLAELHARGAAVLVVSSGAIALGRLLRVSEDFEESACAKAPGAQAYLGRIGQIRKSVKSTVIQRIADLAIKNEDTGSNETLAQCEEGGGGSCWVIW